MAADYVPCFMHRFRHGKVEIAFLDEGEGEPIVLVHGFASTKEVNWVYPGWVSTLVGAGRRAIALDNRGHGQSSKLYDPADYHTDRMVEDVLALLDHLGLARADLFGYSMGARICAFLAAHDPAPALAPSASRRGGAIDPGADADRGRHQGQRGRVGAGARRAHPGRPGARYPG